MLLLFLDSSGMDPLDSCDSLHMRDHTCFVSTEIKAQGLPIRVPNTLLLMPIGLDGRKEI
jgi:hypothetical protein